MKLFRHDCAKHGHRYEARYDETPMGRLPEFKGYAVDLLAVMDRMKDRHYVRDICVHCGHVIERNRKPDLRAVS